MKQILNYFSAISVGFLLVFTIAACSSDKKTVTPNNESSEHHEGEAKTAHLNKAQIKAIDLKVDTIAKREMSNILQVTGQTTVYPKDKADISTYIDANVKKIYVYQGDKVKKGQVLALLEHPSFIKLQADYLATFNQYNYLTNEFKRQKTLFAHEVGSKKKFQKVTAEYNTAKNQYQALKIQLEMLGVNTSSIEKGNIKRYINIISPIDGYVNAININIGHFVSAGSQLFTVSNLDNLHVELTVYEKDIAKVKIGQKIRLKSETTNEELIGFVFAIAKEYEANSKSVIVHVNLKTKPKTLIVGHFIKGEILLDKTKVSAVPKTAIVNNDGHDYIFIFKGIDQNDGNLFYEMEEVILGKEQDDWQEITLVSEISPDTKVVYNGAYYLLSDMLKAEAEHTH